MVTERSWEGLAGCTSSDGSYGSFCRLPGAGRNDFSLPERGTWELSTSFRIFSNIDATSVVPILKEQNYQLTRFPHVLDYRQNSLQDIKLAAGNGNFQNKAPKFEKLHPRISH